MSGPDADPSKSWQLRRKQPSSLPGMQHLKRMFRERNRKKRLLTSRLDADRREHVQQGDMLTQVETLLSDTHEETRAAASARGDKELQSRIDRQHRALRVVLKELRAASANHQLAAKRAADQARLVAEFVEDTLQWLNRENKHWRSMAAAPQPAAAAAAAAAARTKRERGTDSNVASAKRRRRAGDPPTTRGGAGGGGSLTTTLFGLYRDDDDGGGGGC